VDDKNPRMSARPRELRDDIPRASSADAAIDQYENISDWNDPTWHLWLAFGRVK
jgi:hypothetical protein